MKLTKLYHIMAGAGVLSMCNQLEAPHGHDATVAQTDPSQINGSKPEAAGKAGMNYEAMGKQDALEIIEQENKAKGFARERIYQRALELAGHPTAEDWLKGYGDQFGTAAKQRRREARSVFLAVSKPDSGTVEEARQKLEGFQGGYHDWINLAVEIKGKQAGGRRSGEGQKKVTDKQLENIEQAIPVMSPAQAMQVGQKLTASIARMPNAEIAILRQITAQLSILEKSGDRAIVRFAEETREKAYAIIAAHDEAEQQKKATAAQHEHGEAEKPEAQEFEAPQPAEQAATGTHG
jgi:hypothetical protein